MYCSKCGAQARDGDRFCSACGSALTPANYIDPFEPQSNYAPPPAPPQQYQNGQQQQQPAEENNCAILGFIFSFIFPIIGLILSILGLQKRQYYNLAVAGAIISTISIILCVIIVIVVVVTYTPYYPYI